MFFFSVLLLVLFAFYFCSVSRISSSTTKTKKKKKNERCKPAALSMNTRQLKPRKKTRPERKV